MEILEIQTNVTKRFLCEICGRSYKLKRDMDSHLVKHESNSYPYKCYFCSKSFTQRNSLARHLIMHTAEKPFQCQICNKQFVHHSSYNFHKMCHSGARPHKCPLCSKGFRTTTHLKRHMKAHSPEKSLKRQDKVKEKILASMKKNKQLLRCYVCEKSFDSIHEFEEHTIGHLKAT
ncbi:unnamed protein product [Phaedon cochleariae]|uniref:C2H2-type domain-containing protein n=1 Tax=Phaedon cochleariae TaxID=80249 RepID=A0A9N9SKC7_PHACE|nr:unnamed protein product [Phaedon cochleariae]